ncbi:ABC transporter substrate-binding protein [Angustibacter aerolatus]
MRTRNLAHMLAPATVLALAACGGVGSGGSGDDDTKASGGKVTITTMGFGTPDEIATSRLKTYESAADGGPVKVTEGGFDQQQFLSAVASGNPPDVVYLSRDDVGTFAASGAIQPMTDCIKSANVDMSQYRAPAVAQVTLASTVYALPEFYGLRLLISDDDVLAKAGVPVSDVATGDWDTIEAANDRLTKGSGRGLDVIGYDPRVPDTLQLWTAANGGEMLSADGRTAKLNDPKVVEALQFTTDLVKREGRYSDFKAYRESADFFGAKNQYVQDQIGAMPIDDFYLNVLADVSPKTKVTVSPFLGRDGRPVNVSGGQAWAIPKGAKHAEQACRFARTMTAADTWLAAAKARKAALDAKGSFYLGTNTGNSKADAMIREQVLEPTGNAALDAGVKVLQAAQEQAVPLPATAAGAEFKIAYTDAATRVLEGKQTPQQALDQAQQEAQKAIDKGFEAMK